MKQFCMLLGSLLIIAASAIAQRSGLENMMAVKEHPFGLKSGKEKQYLVTTRIKDSLYFRTEDNILLASIPYPDKLLPDTVSQEMHTSIKRIVNYRGKQHTSIINYASENGITITMKLYIDDKEILGIDNRKGFHCNNHGSVVHKCPCAPELAKPPCSKECVWVVD